MSKKNSEEQPQAKEIRYRLRKDAKGRKQEAVQHAGLRVAITNEMLEKASVINALKAWDKRNKQNTFDALVEKY